MIALLLDGLAAYRLTRLVTADALLHGPRDNLVWRAYQAQKEPRGRIPGVLAEEEGIKLLEPGGWSALAQIDPHAPKLATLVTCRFCAGVWVSFGVVAARRLAPKAWHPVATALAYSAVAALMAGLEDD